MQGMLVYRKQMIVIILNPVNNSLEFRENSDEEPRGQHFIQRIDPSWRRHQQLFKQFDDPLRRDECLIRQILEFLNQPLGFG